MRVVVTGVVAFCLVLGGASLLGSVSATGPDGRSVHCGSPAVALAFGDRYEDATPCRDAAAGQVTGGVLCAVLAGALVWGWRRSHRQLVAQRLRAATGHHPLVRGPGGVGVLRVNAHELIVEHPYLAEPLRLRQAEIAVAPVRRKAHAAGPKPDLAFGTPSSTNLLVRLEAPVDVGPFTNQGVRSLGLGGPHPVPAEVLTFAVEGTPDVLLTELAHLGVPRELRRAAPPHPRDARRTARLGIVAAGLAVTMLFAVPPAVLGGQGAGFGASEVLLALVVAAAVAVAEKGWWPHAPRDPDGAGRVAGFAVASLAVAGAPALVAATVPFGGGPWAVEWGLAAGVPAGMLAGWALHVVDAPDVAWR